MAQRLGFEVEVIDVEWGRRPMWSRVRADKQHKIKGVLACHAGRRQV
jgi:alanine-glyoxylate transaminase/serine-glyoxylate transaminase/serine-pyruvate transaminase